MDLLISIILSFFAIRGFRYVVDWHGLTLRNTESFLWVLLFLLFVRISLDYLKSRNNRVKIHAAFWGGIIALFYIVGISFEKQSSIAWIWESIRNLVNCLNMYFSYMFVFTGFAFIAFSFLADPEKKRLNFSAEKFSIRKVLIVWGILLLFYLPWYLFFYPGVMTYDSGFQVVDALSVDSLQDANPAFVTLLIRMIIVPVEKLTGSVQLGVGICSFLQMMILTFVFALEYERICHYIHNKILRIMFFLWFAIYPVNNIYSITMWKDILFSACLICFLLCLDTISENEEAFFSRKKNCVMLFLTLLFLPLFRHNGIFITVIMSVYMLFRFKKSIRRVAVIGCSALAIFGLWKLGILPLLHTTTAPSHELLAVPLQQTARVMRAHHNDMSPWKLEALESYYDIPEIWNNYEEKTADPLKAHFKSGKFDEDPKGFLSLWAEIGKKYPVEYLEAFLNNNYGYWFPETSWWITGIGIVIYEPIGDIHREPILKPRLLNAYYEWYHTAQYKKIPVIPLLFKPGAVFWCWLFCSIYCLYCKCRKFVLCMPGFLIWLTLLFSAVYCEFRYAYGLFVTLPLLLAAVLTKQREE